MRCYRLHYTKQVQTKRRALGARGDCTLMIFCVHERCVCGPPFCFLTLHHDNGREKYFAANRRAERFMVLQGHQKNGAMQKTEAVCGLDVRVIFKYILQLLEYNIVRRTRITCFFEIYFESVPSFATRS